MTEKMETVGKMWLVISALILLIALGASYVSAAEECFKMSPFDDDVTLGWSQPAPDVNLYILQLRWNGATAYALHGGGEAVSNMEASKIVLEATMHNPTLTFFGGNPVCRLHAVMGNPGLAGPWAMDCMRKASTGSTFEVAGTLTPVTCGGGMLAPGASVPYLAGEPVQ